MVLNLAENGNSYDPDKEQMVTKEQTLVAIVLAS
jgi:hypothetical protein